MMTFQNLLTKIPQWTLGKIPDGYTSKDIARITAINIFGLIIVSVAFVYSVVFYLDQDYYLFWVILSLAIFCSIPLVLNALSLFFISRNVYAVQAPVLVLLFTNLLGPAFGIQYFFVLLFSFPFVYFKSDETRRIILFYIYNVLCMTYFEFGGTLGFEEATFTPQIYQSLKITIFLMFVVMTFVLFFAFYMVIILDEQKIVKSRFEMDKAIHGRHEFLSAMSHEIRTPLNDVVTITNILNDNPEHKDRIAFINLLKQTSNNLLSITNDIMDFSELEANKSKLILKNRDLKKIINGLAQTYRSVSEQKGLKLSVEIDPGLDKYYLIDETKLTQVLGNLITNAINYTHEGIIQLTVNKGATEGFVDEITFEVSDTGTGITSNELEKIFESYAQIKTFINDSSKGSGLGLAIVKRLLKLYDSDITVESAPGIGSKFSFKLRLRKGKKSIEHKNSELSVLIDKRVLLVEDNNINAMVAEKLLENWGIYVTKKENGKEAVDALASNEFDFILMDLHMPVMNGFEAVKEIRKIENLGSIPIYALTADVLGDSNEELNGYFDGFLSKPIDKEKLQSIMVAAFSN